LTSNIKSNRNEKQQYIPVDIKNKANRNEKEQYIPVDIKYQGVPECTSTIHSGWHRISRRTGMKKQYIPVDIKYQGEPEYNRTCRAHP
jgi:hypothetical protein